MKFLYGLVVKQPHDFHWLFSSTVPNWEIFVSVLLERLSLPFVILAQTDSRPIGFVSLYNLRLDSGVSHFGICIEGSLQGSGIGTEALWLHLKYCAAKWNIRKFYGEIPEWSVQNIRSHLNKEFVEEGRLRDHFYRDGRYWDCIIAAYTPAQRSL
jgi:RimJ/RimL family protein N-acetyltransferase